MDPPQLFVREAGGGPYAGLLRHRGHGQLHQTAQPPGDILDVPVCGKYSCHHLHLHLGADRQLCITELPK